MTTALNSDKRLDAIIVVGDSTTLRLRTSLTRHPIIACQIKSHRNIALSWELIYTAATLGAVRTGINQEPVVRSWNGDNDPPHRSLNEYQWFLKAKALRDVEVIWLRKPARSEMIANSHVDPYVGIPLEMEDSDINRMVRPIMGPAPSNGNSAVEISSISANNGL